MTDSTALDSRDDGPSLGGGQRSAYVRSLARGLAVIRAFDGDNPRLTLSEVARVTGLTRAASRRSLLTLVELGYARTDGRLFWLGPRVLDLGYAFLSSLTLPEVARPHMEQLVATVHESCSLSVLDDEEIVYVERVPAKRIMAVAINVGTRFPAHATSMGNVLLAALPADAREDYLRTARLVPLTPRTVTDPNLLRTRLESVVAEGYALVDEELEQGLRAVAVPIRDRNGTVVAAMNVSTTAARRSVAATRAELLPPLYACAAEVEADLRRRPA